jgi:hypothetical protein
MAMSMAMGMPIGAALEIVMGSTMCLGINMAAGMSMAALWIWL